MEAKYNGIHLDYFRPELSHQAFEADPAYDSSAKKETQKRNPNSQERSDTQQKRMTFGYHTNQWSSDLNNDYLKKINASTSQMEQAEVDERNSLQLKQTKSMPIATKKSNNMPKMAQKSSFQIPASFEDNEAD
jgi:hypothetical protein